MGISHSTARWVAPVSFAIDFAAQQYGMMSSPNMKDVHDANLSFWSPQPYFIAGFFFPQQLFQLAWLYRLWKLDPEKSAEEKKGGRDDGRFCSLLRSWMIFWNASALKTANVLVLINSFTQLYYIFGRLPPMNTRSTSSVLTHIVSKTFAGIGVLDFLHNGSVAYFDHQGPSTAVKVLTGLGFGALATSSDWIFGGCLVYDLIALAVGQRGIGETSWSNLLGIYAVGAAGIVAAKNLARPPYVKQDPSGYEAASTEDVV
ncbi:hypothetical protein LSUB1_G002352 [Lachnellula subtilissima]|uniref:Concanavalin a-like lectins glucanase protein n=1 Tax=Lachnellula subtilissima TaxID=602034 RepID=A0A8H8UB93_9HELO|nr:hypothetical protein LSUB1_G002352 [Lachnellula subtilissima]